MTNVPTPKERTVTVRSWEMIVLFLEVILVDACVLAVFLVGAPQLLQGIVDLPAAVWAGIGFFVLFWANVPLLNISMRSKRGHGLPRAALLVSSVAGALVGGFLFGLLT